MGVDEYYHNMGVKHDDSCNVCLYSQTSPTRHFKGKLVLSVVGISLGAYIGLQLVAHYILWIAGIK